MRALTSLLLMALLAGCGDGEGPANAYIEADIDGVRWRAEATEGIVVHAVDDPDGSGRVFSIASRKVGRGTQLISLGLPNPPALGIFVIDGEEVTGSFASCPDDVLADCINWEPIPGNPGTLEITAIDPNSGRIVGSFSFPAYPLGDSTETPRSLTSGSFDIRAPGVFVLE